MEQLPYEIQLDIFKSLTNQEKLAYSYVSKDWNRLVKPYLFSNVIIQNDLNLTNAIAYFYKHTRIATTVCHFGIKVCGNALLYLPQIQGLLPNLEKLKFSSNKELQLVFPPEITCVSGAWNNLKELVASELVTTNNLTLVEQVMSHPCPKLTRLSFDMLGKSLFMNEKTFDRVANKMHNAPQLSKLDISSTIGLCLNLETIHQNAPNLKSLALSHLESIKPTNFTGSLETVRLADLSVQFFEEPDDTVFTFDYIIGKYIGLTSFSLTVESGEWVFEDFPTDELERLTLPLFARCPQLKYYDQSFFPLTPTILNEMERCGIHLEGIKLYIDGENVERQCRALSNSNQSNHITRLFLSLQDRSPDDADEDDEYAYLEDLHDVQIVTKALASLVVKNLTDITIKANRFNQICLSELNGFLNTMPQLSRIAVHDMKIMPNRNIININTKLPIKTIQIHNLKLRSLEERLEVSMVMRTLLSQCPDLEEFVLDMSFKDIPREDLASITLDFRKNHKLNSIVVDAGDDRNQFYIMRSNPAADGYYLYDRRKNTLVKKNSLPSGKYYTTILLSRPALLNSHQI